MMMLYQLAFNVQVMFVDVGGGGCRLETDGGGHIIATFKTTRKNLLLKII